MTEKLKRGMARILPLNLGVFLLLVSLVWVACYNPMAWRAFVSLVPQQGASLWLILASFGGFLTAFFVLLLTLVSSRYVIKPLLVLLFLFSAMALYFMSTYGVSIDDDMIQNVMETDPAEVTALLSVRMAVYLLLFGVLPAVVVWRLPVVYPSFWRGGLQRVLWLVASVLMVAITIAPFYSTYAPIFREPEKLTHFINPSNYIYGLGKYSKRALGVRKDTVVKPVGTDSKTGAALAARPRPSLVVLVVGETARADHFSLNGYARDTNPVLRAADVLNYSQVSSCGTATAISVPCMFSRFGRESYSDKKGKTNENVLDMLQRAGIPVFWRDNNSGDCKGVCARIPHDEITHRRESPFCNDIRCLDEVMLEDDLQAKVDAQAGHFLLVLHSDGSHGPEYYDRYPPAFERFTPVCRTNQLGACTREELANVYDNTILYTDHFLGQVIAFLKRNADKRDVAMLYVSDHGESLGEDGLFLHAAPYAIAPAAQTHVPMVAWFSPGAYTSWGLSPDCLRKHQGDTLSHDNLFHSLLGLFDVQTSEYKPSLDMFLPCRQ